MYCYLNYFSFEKPKGSVSQADIVSTFNLLYEFCKDLDSNGLKLIIGQRLALYELNGDTVKGHIRKVAERDKRNFLATKITNYSPFCSDTYTPYEDEESIVLGDCHEEKEHIPILENFLACAAYHKSPVVTPDLICSREQFLEPMINIVCKENSLHILNFRLSNYKDSLNAYIKQLRQGEYLAINNWIDYQSYINDNFDYIRITDDCLESIREHCSFDNEYAKCIKDEVIRINKFIRDNSGNPQAIDFKRLGKHYNPEPSTRFTALKKSHSNIRGCSGNNIYLDWHLWINGDFRLYFTREIDHICMVYYTKKIS